MGVLDADLGLPLVVADLGVTVGEGALPLLVEEAEAGARDGDLVVVAQVGRADVVAVELRAPAALQILDHELVGQSRDLGVLPRDGGVLQVDVGGGAAADDAQLPHRELSAGQLTLYAEQLLHDRPRIRAWDGRSSGGPTRL